MSGSEERKTTATGIRQARKKLTCDGVRNKRSTDIRHALVDRGKTVGFHAKANGKPVRVLSRKKLYDRIYLL